MRIFTRSTRTAGLVATAALALVPATALADGGVSPEGTRSENTVSGDKAKLVDGKAIAPESAPRRVKRVIKAANEIRNKPYRYGGGHASFRDSGYDCSGAASYALHGGGLLDSALDSGALMHYGSPGRGRHITIYANPGHAYMVVNGRRFDTTGRSETGSRWQWRGRSSSGYTVRHPPGL